MNRCWKQGAWAPPPSRRSAVSRKILCGLVLGVLVGCSAREQAAPTPHSAPTVELASPQRRTIERKVGQPAFINAFEQTSIYPKISGYLQKWNVDIGDPIKKDQVLAEIFAPELQADYERRKAELARDDVLIRVAEQSVAVAEKTLQVSIAEIKRASSEIGSYQAAVDRWQSEVDRLRVLADKGVIDRPVFDESVKQLMSNKAARGAAEAGVTSAEATSQARQADLDKSKVDVEAARSTAQVAQAEVVHAEAFVTYTKLTAPYDGIVTQRNANTGDFVQPATGDKSVARDAGARSAASMAPIYVVARTDLVRVFVDVPEMDAQHVARGTDAEVRVQSLDDAVYRAQVTRSSWALNVQSRTLRAEIDLPNSDARLQPGMYAYATVLVRRENVLAIPLPAVIELGSQKCCYLYRDGKALKTELQVGETDGHWIEVAKKKIGENWEPMAGDESVILGDLAELSNGLEVRLGEKLSQEPKTQPHPQ